MPPELLAGVRTPRCPGEPSAPAETASVAANPAARSQRSARELLRVHPAYAARLQEVGLDSATALIELPGEIVCGHPDRHVRRVVRPDLGGTFYLKRQHRVGWRERWRNWRLGFGWVSRSVREGQLLEQLQACGLAVPQWVAYGEDGRGRAFLLVEELPETCDLLQLLRGAGPASAVALHGPQRLRLARDLGEMLYRYHQAGFVTPNVQAKHLLYQPRTRQWFLIDWASAARKGRVTVAERAAALATLHASVPAGGCGLRDRLRVLRAALGMARGPQSSLARQQWRRWLVRVQRLAKRLVGRRSVREQRQGLADGLRWVWLAEEAVCVTPAAVRWWPRPADQYPFYGGPPGRWTLPLPAGRRGCLVRGRGRCWLSRLWAWCRGRSWRSAAARWARLAVHLHRHGLAAPAVIAFGQRVVGLWGLWVEWFVLHEEPAPAAVILDAEMARRCGELLGRLHRAGVAVDERWGVAALGWQQGQMVVRDYGGLRLVRRVSRRLAQRQLRRLLQDVPPQWHVAMRCGYEQAIELPQRLSVVGPLRVSPENGQ